MAAGGVASVTQVDPTQSLLGATATVSNLNVTAQTSAGLAGLGPAAGMTMAMGTVAPPQQASTLGPGYGAGF